jgi:hypothetical protein
LFNKETRKCFFRIWMLLIDLIKEIRVISFKFKCRVKKINVEVFCTKKKC